MATHAGFDTEQPGAMSRQASVLIYGSGAVGSIFGWRLAQHGLKVSVVCRSNYDAVKRLGFVFETAQWGNGNFVPHQVYRAGSGMPSTRYDYVVCANKVSNENYPSIINELRQVADEDTTFVAAQNGMDIELPIKQAFPHNTILSAICNIGCTQSSGFVQQRAGLNPKAFLLGVYGHHNDQENALSKRDFLVACDTKFGSVDKICQQRWKKLLFNAVWNATSALTNLDTHQALVHPDALHLATRLSREANRLAIKAGADLDEHYADEVIALARRAGAITPSTLQDARNGRVMEIDSIWGYLVQKARSCRVSVPTIELAHDLLRQMNTSFSQENFQGPFADRSIIAWPDTSLSSPWQWLDDRVMLQAELERYTHETTVVA